MIVRSIDQLIGNTPVIHLEKLSADVKRNIYLKLEFLNPGGSVKDRIALSMIDAAMAKGDLKPGCRQKHSVCDCHAGKCQY